MIDEDNKNEEINEEISTENEETSNNPFAPKDDSEQEQSVDESAADSQELEKIKSDYEKLHNQYLRLAADFDNYRKRQQQEREQLLQYGTQEALKKMIDVLDNFDRAAQSCENVDDAGKIRECFSVLEKQTKDVLVKIGLTEINTEGAEFDPSFHEVVMRTPTSEHKENEIINVLQKGYMYQDKVLRPSRVNVAVSE